MNLPALVDAWAAGWADRPALVDHPSQSRWTFRQLAFRMRQTAGAFRAAGLLPGERVAYWTHDRPECVEILLGAAAAGLTWVPVNDRFTLEEAYRQLHHAAPQALLVDEAHLGDAVRLRSRLPAMRLYAVLDRTADAPDFLRWPVLRDRAVAWTAGTPPPACVGILYTSGTTGSPKGVMHTPATFWAWCVAVQHAARWTWSDRVVVPYPFFHMGGVGFSLAVLMLGAEVILPGRPTPATLATVVAEERATALVAAPTVLNNLVREPGGTLPDKAWATMRHITATSAPLWEETAAELRQRWPQVDVTELYSATEAVFSFLPSDDRPGHPRSVGRPALGARLTIRDEGGHPVPANVAGLIWTQGPSVFQGYLAPAADDLPDPSGWHTCGDVGYVDADGCLYIIDRQNDLINTGGEKVSSGEVEDLLLHHPAVLEAAVIGLPDPIWGERIHAVVRLRGEGARPTAEELRLWCRGRLAAFKLPKSIRIADELPKNAVGKLLKRVLRATESLDLPPQ